MSQAAPIDSYEPERLGNVWPVKRQASRTSPSMAKGRQQIFL
jgi:hypothetical protein